MFFAGWFGDGAGQVVVASPGHADVEVFGAGGPVNREHALVDGETLAFVDGDGIGQPDVLVDVLAGEGEGPSAVEGGQLE